MTENWVRRKKSAPTPPTVVNVSQYVRRGPTNEWEDANPTLRPGELGLDLTLSKFKIGDGAAPWNDLPYFTVIGNL